MRSGETTTISRVLSDHSDRLAMVAPQRALPLSRRKSKPADSIPNPDGGRYILCVTCRKPSAASYIWQVIRGRDSTELARSGKTFATFTETLADAARVVAPLALGGIDLQLMEIHQAKG